MPQDVAEGPAPDIDPHSAPYWAGLAEGRIVLQVCATCGRHRFPRMPACPYCGAPGGEDADVSGDGTIYSFIRAHRALSPAYTGELPYAIATVELDEGVRIVARVEPPEAAEIGVRVGPAFVARAGWTELQFRPAG